MLPKISCLTVTSQRLALLKESIACYIDQTYPNKEMVIVTNAGQKYEEAIEDYLNTLEREDIRLIGIDGDKELGALRNLSVGAAEGEIIVNWDDDDLYHPERLQLQYDHMIAENAEACLLSDHLSYFVARREMYWVDWKPQHPSPKNHVLPGTIMAFKNKRLRYPEAGQFASKGEDSVFLSQFRTIAVLSDKGYIYVYRYHGTNTYSEDHHRWIANVYIGSNAFVEEKMDSLLNALSIYPLPEPYAFITQDQKKLFLYQDNKANYEETSLHK